MATRRECRAICRLAKPSSAGSRRLPFGPAADNQTSNKSVRRKGRDQGAWLWVARACFTSFRVGRQHARSAVDAVGLVDCAVQATLHGPMGRRGIELGCRRRRRRRAPRRLVRACGAQCWRRRWRRLPQRAQRLQRAVLAALGVHCRAQCSRRRGRRPPQRAQRAVLAALGVHRRTQCLRRRGRRPPQRAEHVSARWGNIWPIVGLLGRCGQAELCHCAWAWVLGATRDLGRMCQ
jgi:hypothetical protein